jgi:hypothetical protein
MAKGVDNPPNSPLTKTIDDTDRKADQAPVHIRARIGEKTRAGRVQLDEPDGPAFPQSEVQTAPCLPGPRQRIVVPARKASVTGRDVPVVSGSEKKMTEWSHLVVAKGVHLGADQERIDTRFAIETAIDVVHTTLIGAPSDGLACEPEPSKAIVID